MKIEVVNTDYPIEVPNGSVMTVVEDLGDGCVGATKDGGDDFEWFMRGDTYIVMEPALTIEAGKYYRTRDGRKVGPVEENQMPNDPWPWKSTDDGQFVAFDKDGKAVGEYLVDGMKPNLDLIAEWTEDDAQDTTPETGTLAELNVKPGDVVEWPGIGRYTVMQNGDVIAENGVKLSCGIDYEGGRFRIISRASDTFKCDYSFMSSDVRLPDGNDPYLFGDGDPVSASDTPKTWGEMSDSEKGAIALGFVQGKVVQCWQDGDTPEYWADIPDPNWSDDCKFRIKPQPQRETVTLYGVCGEFSDRFIDDHDTHRITFDTIDGTPDLTSIKMERV